MSATFDEVVKKLPEMLRRLTQQSPCSPEKVPVTKDARGVYLLSESGQYIYVGRGRLKHRLRSHLRGTPDSASFAVKLARKATGQLATYRSDNSIKTLRKDAAFMAAFDEAKQRIGRMQVRFIGIDNDLEECLFEIYASTALRTKYNTWNTH